MLLYQTLVFTVHENILKSHIRAIHLKTAPTWNDKFELSNPSYSISDIQDYFEYILKKIWDSYWQFFNVNKIENRITFKIKIGYYLKLLTPETMKLLGSTKSKITKHKSGEKFPYL